MDRLRLRCDAGYRIADSVDIESRLFESAYRVLSAVIEHGRAVRRNVDLELLLARCDFKRSVLLSDVVVRSDRAFVERVSESVLALSYDQLASRYIIGSALARGEASICNAYGRLRERSSVIFLFVRCAPERQLPRSYRQLSCLDRNGELIRNIFALSVGDDRRAARRNCIFAGVLSRALRRDTGNFISVSVNGELRLFEAGYFMLSSVICLASGVRLQLDLIFGLSLFDRESSRRFCYAVVSCVCALFQSV